MVTGASTADVALVLVDARKGMQPQSRRHAYISSLLGIKHILVCVNKMDLVDFDQKVFTDIENDFREFVKDINIPDIRFFPISALNGDNVVTESQNMAWYTGDTVLKTLEEIEVIPDQDMEGFRFPVQYVNRPDASFRGYCGTVVNGLVKKGDDVVVLPVGQKTKVKDIVTYDGSLEETFSPMAVTITLEDDIDISRGDMIVGAVNAPEQRKEFSATICWMDQDPIQLKKKYFIKHGYQLTKVVVTKVEHKVNINSLEKESSNDVNLNEIAKIHIKSMKPLFIDSYKDSRATGSFILIDETSHNTVAAGMVD